ncbi:MAG: glycosyltransferase family 2 protein [Patescibacteria group bacterium]
MISIIIVTHNRPQKLQRCLDSIAKNMHYPHEISVINNSINNIGPTAARNKGARETAGEWLLFLDDDAWIDRLPAEEIIRYTKEHPEVGLISPRLLNPDGTLQPSIRSFPTSSALAWRGTFLHKLFPNAPWYKKYMATDKRTDKTVTTKIDWAISACILVSRKAWNDVGGFDEKYFFMHEDTDFCFRLKQKGYERIYWHDATVYHDYARTSSKLFNRNFIHHIRGALRVLGTMKREMPEATRSSK